MVTEGTELKRALGGRGQRTRVLLFCAVPLAQHRTEEQVGRTEGTHVISHLENMWDRQRGRSSPTPNPEPMFP